MFARGSPRVLRFSPASLFLSFSSLSLFLSPFGPLNRIFLFSLPSPRPANGLAADWFGVRVEPKSLLMGSFGFDHRLTFPIHRWYVSLARTRFISSSLIYSFSYPPRSNLYSIESLLSGLLIRHRLRRGEWNKERWNESLGERRRKVRLVVKNVDWKINSTYLSRLHRSVR